MRSHDLDPQALKDTLRKTRIPVGQIQSAIVSMLRLGLQPYVTTAFDGTQDLALMTATAGPGNDSITMVFERLRILSKTEATLAINAGAGQFISHTPAPPSLDDLPDPTG